MGGGVSIPLHALTQESPYDDDQNDQINQTLNTTNTIISLAFQQLTFPELYNIQDFHSPSAKPLKKPKNKFNDVFGFGIGFGSGFYSNFGNVEGKENDASDSDDDDDDDDDDGVDLGVSGPISEEEADAQGGTFALVTTSIPTNRIILESVNTQNSSNWTPLHACCHNPSTIPLALLLIQETIASNGDLNVKTTKGPGLYNSLWSPLQMAASYGLLPIVSALLDSPTDCVDVNSVNSIGLTPLLSSIYRGYTSIVRTLLQHGANYHFLPDSAKFSGDAFLRVHAQYPIAEACRCGYFEIVQLLISSGSDINLQNGIGNTAIHEACYINNLSIVQILMKAGCDTTIKNSKSILPIQLTVMKPVKDYIAKFGGEGSLPEAGEVESVFGIGMGMGVDAFGGGGGFGGGGSMFGFNFGDGGDSSDDDDEVDVDVDVDGSYLKLGDGYADDDDDDDDKEETKEEYIAKTNAKSLLGNLPTLNQVQAQAQATPTKTSSTAATTKQKTPSKTPTRRKKQKKRKDILTPIPLNSIPSKFKCSISQKVLTHPVTSPSNHTFEYSTIKKWLEKHGNVCPITGVPLMLVELRGDEGKLEEMRGWREEWFRGKGGEGAAGAGAGAGGVDGGENGEDDKGLYDF